MTRSRQEVWRMFDRIAPRYDLLNRVLSFGMDAGWRKRVRAHLPEGDALQVLDVATGTGDLAFTLAADHRVTRVVGVDMSEEMLDVAKEKCGDRPCDFRRGDAMDLSAYAATFDVATIAFGIRNVLDPVVAMRTMKDALLPRGKVMVLEFGEPDASAIRTVYGLYRKQILPRIGAMVSGDDDAYHYLDETIAEFPCGEAYLDLMRQAGLRDCFQEKIAFGAVRLYVGHA